MGLWPQQSFGEPSHWTDEPGAADARVNASELTELVVTDSIYREGLSDGGKIRRLTIAPLFGEAIHRIADESSVSSLFD